MRCWLFNIATVVSAVMLVVVAGLWVGSFFRSSATFGCTGTSDLLHYEITRGKFRIVKYEGISFPDTSTWQRQVLGFGSSRQNYMGCRVPSRSTTIAIPFWSFALLAGIMPTVWLITGHHRGKLPEHTCVQCGYDLRGTLMAGRSECPECGCSID